jgi:hypothetical protein
MIWNQKPKQIVKLAAVCCGSRERKRLGLVSSVKSSISRAFIVDILHMSWSPSLGRAMTNTQALLMKD